MPSLAHLLAASSIFTSLVNNVHHIRLSVAGAIERLGHRWCGVRRRRVSIIVVASGGGYDSAGRDRFDCQKKKMASAAFQQQVGDRRYISRFKPSVGSQFSTVTQPLSLETGCGCTLAEMCSIAEAAASDRSNAHAYRHAADLWPAFTLHRVTDSRKCGGAHKQISCELTNKSRVRSNCSPARP